LDQSPGIQGASSFSPADLNLDGKVDAVDFQLIRAAIGSCAGMRNFNAYADMDGDECVTLKDYQMWFQIYSAAQAKQ
jgi:hypothetical protein